MFCEIQDVTELNYKPQKSMKIQKTFIYLKQNINSVQQKTKDFIWILIMWITENPAVFVIRLLFLVSIWNVLYLILKCLPVSMPTLLCFCILWYLLFYHDLHSQSSLIMLLSFYAFFYQDTYRLLKLCITSFSFLH